MQWQSPIRDSPWANCRILPLLRIVQGATIRDRRYIGAMPDMVSPTRRYVQRDHKPGSRGNFA
jgi:hypothetical protein